MLKRTLPVDSRHRAPHLAGRLLALALVVLATSRAEAQRSNADLPKKFQRAPWSRMSLSVGRPNDGWQLRAKRLRDTPFLRVRASSRVNSFGHPSLVLMLQRSARDIARAHRGSVLVVGDLSAESGGPLSGHRSHQSGRDADVGFYVMDGDGKPVTPDHFPAFDAEGRARDGSGLRFDDARNWALLLSWARDSRAGLAHVFVATWLERRLLAYGKRTKEWERHGPSVMRLLLMPESASAHDDHFHVRIACPARHEGLCVSASS